MDEGELAVSSAAQEVVGEKAAERRGALMSETAVLMADLLMSGEENVVSMEGKGSSHRKVWPRSPCVPRAQSHALEGSVIGGWSSAQSMYVSSEVVETGGQPEAVTYWAPSGKSAGPEEW